MKIVCCKAYIDECGDKEIVELFMALIPFLVFLNLSDFNLTKSIVSSNLQFLSPMMQTIHESKSLYLGLYFLGVYFNTFFVLTGCHLEKLRTQREMVDSVHAILSHEKPFSDQELNRKLFESILTRIVDPSNRPSQSLPALFIVSALIRNEPDSLTAIRMSTRYVDALCKMLNFSKVTFNQLSIY